MKRFALVLCGLVSTGIAFAGGPVTDETVFPEGTLPAGWHASTSGLISPTFSNYVSHISLTYSEERAGVLGTLALFATNHSSHAESKIADLNTLTSAAQFDFAASTDFRAFRLVTNGVSISSFTAIWMDTRLSAPTNITIANNTGSSFDISWNPVEDATGYKVSVWTNVTVGASAGTALWAEGFANSDATSSTSASFDGTKHTDDKTTGWTSERTYRSIFQGVVKVGSSSAAGWIATPPFTEACNGDSLEISLRACVTNSSVSEQIPISVVSGTTTNDLGIIEMGLEMKDWYVPVTGISVGDSILIHSPVSTKASNRPTLLLDNLSVVTGHSDGTETPVVFREETVAGDVTYCTVYNLPPVAVQVSIQSIAANAADSSVASAATVVDLANPPPQPQLAIPGSVVGSTDGFYESCDTLSGSPTGESEWSNWVTLAYLQAFIGLTPVNKMITASGMGNKSGGWYNYHGTNKNDTASYSLAAVANGSNHIKFGLAVTNELERSLLDFTISFMARQWTFSKNRSAEQSLRFEYLVTNEFVSIVTEGNWVEVDGLRFDAIAPGATSFTEGGEYADYETGSVGRNLSATLQDVVLRPGKVLLIRWTPDPVSNGEALGVDDIRLKCSKQALGTTLIYR